MTMIADATVPTLGIAQDASTNASGAPIGGTKRTRNNRCATGAMIQESRLTSLARVTGDASSSM